jgi:thiamine-phosphate diphosphorylase
VKVDGVHLGQNDLPVELARKMLGEDAIIGLSARAKDLFDYIKTFQLGVVDYFGAGPLRATPTKPDCGMVDGVVLETTCQEIKQFKSISPLPIVVGGGVKVGDLKELRATGIDGFFVVSAITAAEDPYIATKNMVDLWYGTV